MYPDSELAQDLHEKTKKIIYDLDVIWNDIGLDENTRQVRKQLFAKHVQDLYHDMSTEAELSKNVILEQIDNLITKLNELSTDLRLNITMPCEDTPLYEAKKKLELKLDQYGKIHEERMVEVKRLEAKQKPLCEALGIDLRQFRIHPLPTEEEILEFKTYLEKLSDQKFRNEEHFYKRQAEITEIMKVLEIEPTLDFERKVVFGEVTAFQVTEENMSLLEDCYNSLKHRLEDTKCKIDELWDTIKSLWHRLEEELEFRNQFEQKHSGYSVPVLKALKAEITRCNEKKKANIQHFVEKLRSELVVLWDKCKFGPEKRSEFLYFESDCYTDDLLSLHELQVEKIKDFYEKNKHIFELVCNREQLWKKMMELDQRSKQPDRYKNRGGQLLREEKERKQLAAKLPKIEQELMLLVSKFEEENGTPFLINGERVSNIIENEWDEYKENKHITLSARKHARENSRFTPCRSRLVGTPRANTPITPATFLSTTKRKLQTPNIGVLKRTRLYDEKILKTAPPKLQVIGSSFKRASIERKKRIERSSKRRSRRVAETDVTRASTVSDYDGFEREINIRPTCRSSLFPHKVHGKPPTGFPTTPRIVLHPITNTPERTPSRQNLRAKSPLPSHSRLTPAPGTLPIII